MLRYGRELVYGAELGLIAQASAQQLHSERKKGFPQYTLNDQLDCYFAQLDLYIWV